MPEILRDRRLALQMSQADLAAAVGIDKRQIKRYEAGESQPALDVARRIARTLQISLDELAGDPPAAAPLSGEWHVSWQHRTPDGVHYTHQTLVGRQKNAVLALEALDTEETQGPGGLRWHGWFDVHSERVMTGRLRRSANRDEAAFSTMTLEAPQGWEGSGYVAHWVPDTPSDSLLVMDGYLARTVTETEEIRRTVESSAD